MDRKKKTLLPDFLYNSPRAVTALLRRGAAAAATARVGGGGSRSRAADSRKNHYLLLRSGSKYTTTTTTTTTSSTMAVDMVFNFFQGLQTLNSSSNRNRNNSRRRALIAAAAAAGACGGGGCCCCWDDGESMGKFMIPAANEPGKIPMYSKEFYAACTAGGILSCGITHTLVTPMDIVKCNMQIDTGKFKSIGGSFKMILAEQGAKGLYKGWGPTAVGYSLQGACKFGFYEFFKKFYADLAGEPFATDYKTLIYLAGSASAEFVADIALCPFEAVKVRVQTKPGYAKGLTDGMSKFIAAEGFGGLYAGIVPLWGRQIPYTMMKFSIFEKTVEALYANVVPLPKEQCSKNTQLGVSFAAGYIAGILCAIVSHPADNLVSYLNNKKGASIGQAIGDIGTVALFTRGLPLRIFMIGTLTGAQWGIYDAFKVFVGLPTTGGAAPADGSGDHGRGTSHKHH